MSDENTQIANVTNTVPNERYGEMLYYDLGKYLTTVALLALGGVLTLMQSEAFADTSPVAIVSVVVLIVFGGSFALYSSTSITRARYADKSPSRFLKWYIRLAEACISIGLGAFVALFLDLL